MSHPTDFWDTLLTARPAVADATAAAPQPARPAHPTDFWDSVRSALDTPLDLAKGAPPLAGEKPLRPVPVTLRQVGNAVMPPNPMEQAKLVAQAIASRKPLDVLSAGAGLVGMLPGEGAAGEAVGADAERAAAKAILHPPEVPAAGRAVAQEFNAPRMGGSEAQSGEVMDRLKALGLDTRRVQKQADVIDFAREHGIDLAALEKDAARRPLGAVQNAQLANVVGSSSEQIAKLGAQLKAPGLKDAERGALQQALDQHQAALDLALKKLVVSGTEGGRAIAIFRQVANRTMDPDYWLLQAKRQLGDRPLPAEVHDAIREAAAKGDRALLSHIVGGLRQHDWIDKVLFARKVAMLSNPGTDVKNVAGNTAFAILESVKDAPAAMIDKALAKLGGRPRAKMFSPEAAAASVRAIPDAARQAGEYLRTGVDRSAGAMAKYDVPQGSPLAGIPGLEQASNLVLRKLGAEDLMFREPARAGALAELRALGVPPEEAGPIAEREAAYRTFNKPNMVDAAMKGGKSALRRQGPVGRAGAAAVDALFPFVRTPSNIAESIIDYSPLGFAKAPAEARWLPDLTPFERRRMLAEGLGRAVTGTGAAAGGYALARHGGLVGNTPVDRGEMQARRNAEIPDNALALPGGRYADISQLQPVAPIMLGGADVADALRHPEDAARILALSQWGRFTDQPFVQGVEQTGGLFQDPVHYAGTMLRSEAGSLVPSVLGAIARGRDPYRRRVESVPDALANRIPGLRERLEPAINPETGAPVRDQQGVLGALFSPARVTSSNDADAALAALDAGSGIGKPQPRGKVRGEDVRLHGPDATDFYQAMGEASAAAAERVARSPKYQRATQSDRREMLDDARQQARTAARKRFMRQWASGQ